ncbi:NAD/NADP-dependent octopine/nopaline dehydrogenase family protein [Paracoccus saliphilus]|uniref:NAD/NADP octopine/nopaline dehydrogenase family protein n=1 Tax=Paracoccus saliphilus TaxID=405559 RepID=A0AA45W5Q6_9RHOB|nr:NAD/NADP-dependent octopine/nopaline dehydrogenase family protein [Paracoccus saliphilus]WCR05592.1 NAD/NADP octopine/nopaline dehydrogenase family protein [Paracoccus saliphilus]SIS96010.1 opine dehydrogenase [Paracoccus saliphilus]
MKIAVIGGGNGCFAAVADFAEAGHQIGWWRRNGPQSDASELTLIDHKGSREIAVRATDDLAAALDGAELIFIPTPAFSQEDIARSLAPHLRDGQVIFLAPGSFGSLRMAQILREAGCSADIALAETGTLPWLARKQGPDAVRITTRASRLPTGVFPARLTDRALEIIGRAFPGVIERSEDALSGALMNAGPIIHPPLILMNAGPIEHFDRWDIHNEGTQPSIRRIHDALDGERITLRETLGYTAPHFPLRDHYETDQWMYGNLAHDKLVGSGDWHEKLNLDDHRYMSEDIAYGLALLVSVADWAGVDVPVAKGLLALASAVTGRDLRHGPRTIEAMGLSGLSRAEMTELLQGGKLSLAGAAA